jgi:hypothetical protein
MEEEVKDLVYITFPEECSHSLYKYAGSVDKSILNLSTTAKASGLPEVKNAYVLEEVGCKLPT